SGWRAPTRTGDSNARLWPFPSGASLDFGHERFLYLAGEYHFVGCDDLTLLIGVPARGFEPRTIGLKGRCSARLSYTGSTVTLILLAARAALPAAPSPGSAPSRSGPPPPAPRPTGAPATILRRPGSARRSTGRRSAAAPRTRTAAARPAAPATAGARPAAHRPPPRPARPPG